MTLEMENEQGIRLTPAAAKRIATFMAKEGGRGVHLDVRKTGCSGWAYELAIATASARPDEVVFHDQGIEIIITPKALSMMAGTVVDFIGEGLVQEFRFKNPNVTAECGCGESFTINSTS